jgi:biopolymer transport protein ExbB/TolQ
MSKIARNLLFFGIGLFVLGPLIGIGITVFSMTQSFHDLGQSGISDPNVLAGHIGHVLLATSIGLLGAIIGVFMMVAAGFLIYAERNERKAGS